jgi:hypothetical protein
VWSAEKRAEGLEYMHPKPSSQTINPTNILIAGDTKTEASQKPLPTDPYGLPFSGRTVETQFA